MKNNQSKCNPFACEIVSIKVACTIHTCAVQFAIKGFHLSKIWSIKISNWTQSHPIAFFKHRLLIKVRNAQPDFRKDTAEELVHNFYKHILHRLHLVIFCAYNMTDEHQVGSVVYWRLTLPVNVLSYSGWPKHPPKQKQIWYLGNGGREWQRKMYAAQL